MQSFWSCLWALLFASQISAYVLPHQVPGHQSQADTFQRLLHTTDPLSLHTALFNLNSEEQHKKDHVAVESIYKDDSTLAINLVNIAKRQEDGSGNSSVISSTTITTTTPFTESVNSPTSTVSNSIPFISSPTTTTSVDQQTSSSSDTVVVVPTQGSSDNPPPPTTSSTTLAVTTTPSIPPTTTPISTTPSTTPLTTTPSVIITTTTPQITTTTPTLSTTTPSTTSTTTESTTSVTPSLVLITSTQSNGDPVTLTSFVAAPTADQQTTSASPTRSLQPESNGHTLQPWNLGAMGVVFGVMVVL